MENNKSLEPTIWDRKSKSGKGPSGAKKSWDNFWGKFSGGSPASETSDEVVSEFTYRFNQAKNKIKEIASRLVYPASELVKDVAAGLDTGSKLDTVNLINKKVTLEFLEERVNAGSAGIQAAEILWSLRGKPQEKAEFLKRVKKETLEQLLKSKIVAEVLVDKPDFNPLERLPKSRYKSSVIAGKKIAELGRSPLATLATNPVAIAGVSAVDYAMRIPEITKYVKNVYQKAGIKITSKEALDIANYLKIDRSRVTNAAEGGIIGSLSTLALSSPFHLANFLKVVRGNSNIINSAANTNLLNGMRVVGTAAGAAIGALRKPTGLDIKNTSLSNEGAFSKEKSLTREETRDILEKIVKYKYTNNHFNQDLEIRKQLEIFGKNTERNFLLIKRLADKFSSQMSFPENIGSFIGGSLVGGGAASSIAAAGSAIEKGTPKGKLAKNIAKYGGLPILAGSGLIAAAKSSFEKRSEEKAKKFMSEVDIEKEREKLF